MNKNIVIYIKYGCPYCARAKKLLNQKGFQYKEIDVMKNPDLFNKIKSEYNVKTVPQIFIADEDGNHIYHIAGSDKLIDLENTGKLDSILHSGNDTAIIAGADNSAEYGECSLLNNNVDDFI